MSHPPTSNWIRVTSRTPCRVCGKPDWCTLTPDGLVCCMRVESRRPARNGGWLHVTPCVTQDVTQDRDAHRDGNHAHTVTNVIDAPLLMSRWNRDTTVNARVRLADQLGVAVCSLVALQAVWAPEHMAWAFPMHDGQGNVVGIRLRAADGRKWAVRGSRQGVFLPSNISPQTIALVTEGPTDTAAALTLGFWAIGRPSCNTGGPAILATVRRLGIRRVIMVADNDEPGLRGAARVATEIGLPHVTYLPPTKDLREFVRCGGTREMIESSVNQFVWRKP